MIDLTKPLDLRDDEAQDFLKNLQGNILKSHGRSHTAHLFVRFKPNYRNTARAWLKHFAETKVTSAYMQQQQTEDKKKGGEEQLFAMVLLSAKGYIALGLEDKLPQEQSSAFRNGMARRMANDPAKVKWDPPYNEKIHAMILLAHANYDELQKEVQSLEKQLGRFCERVHREEGRKIVRDFDNRLNVPVEHFGYADGISQPILIKDNKVENEITQKIPVRQEVEVGLNVALVEEQSGSQTYGSFMVFRKLEQDKRAFQTYVTELAEKKGKSEEDVGASIIGRYQNGKPLVAFEMENDFTFDDDTDGLRCPFNAHIRKANPRGDLARRNPPLSSVRIVRRGITYGSPPEQDNWDAEVSSDKEVGLLFMSFQADLASFETLHFWADNKDFVKEKVGVDALIGHRGRLADFVTFKGGEYFFAPSLPFLKALKIDPLSEPQKQRFVEAFNKMLEKPGVLQAFGSSRKQDARFEAASLVGVEKEDLDNFHAYVAPFWSLLDAADSYQAPTEDQKNRLSQAFERLLDPAELQKFADEWAKNSEVALANVGLNLGENEEFYTYVKQYGLNLNKMFWDIR
jgi:Dyp-type peroxidase family